MRGHLRVEAEGTLHEMLRLTAAISGRSHWVNLWSRQGGHRSTRRPQHWFLWLVVRGRRSEWSLGLGQGVHAGLAGASGGDGYTQRHLLRDEEEGGGGGGGLGGEGAGKAGGELALGVHGRCGHAVVHELVEKLLRGGERLGRGGEAARLLLPGERHGHLEVRCPVGESASLGARWLHGAGELDGHHVSQLWPRSQGLGRAGVADVVALLPLDHLVEALLEVRGREYLVGGEGVNVVVSSLFFCMLPIQQSHDPCPFCSCNQSMSGNG